MIPEAAVAAVFEANVIAAMPADVDGTGWATYHSALDGRGWSCSAQTRADGRSLARVDVQTIGQTCYLLGIFLDERLRGTGVCFGMYQGVEAFAKAVGCTTIEATASGHTPSGEMRSSWMVRRLGYRLYGRNSTAPTARKAIG